MITLFIHGRYNYTNKLHNVLLKEITLTSHLLSTVSTEGRTCSATYKNERMGTYTEQHHTWGGGGEENVIFKIHDRDCPHVELI
jgi:hypothetical protein